MSTSAFRLLLTHRRLDDEIRAEQTRRLPDGIRLQRLKKLKLAVKDRLLRLSSGNRAHSLA
jgi:uncharacterized protein